MLKSIIALQLLMLYWFNTSPVDPSMSEGIKPKNTYNNVVALTLDCITDTVIVYIPDPSGIDICADDLIHGIDTMIGCETITFTLNDGTNTGTCLNYGVNQIFNDAIPITITAIDNCGGLYSCVVNVEVSDSTAPEIICPLPDTICEFNQAEIPFLIIDSFLVNGGNITDNTFDPMVPIPGSLFSYLGQDTLLDGCNFLLQRSYRIEDFVGLADTCIHTIAVQDTVDVRCPSSINVFTTVNSCSALVIPNYTIASNCDIDTIYNNTSSDSMFLASPVPFDVVYTFVSVCGDTSNCTISFSVIDSFIPSIVCPNNISIECSDTTNAESLSQFISIGGSVNDNCGIDPVTFESNDSIIGSGFCSNIVRTYSIEDIFGNYVSCVQNIFVYDNTSPILTCPTNVSIGTDEDVCYAVTTVPVPTAFDNCGIDTVFNFYTNTAVDTFYLGNTIVIWNAVDNCGNTDTCHVAITVVDDQEPTATSPIQEEVDCSFSEIEIWDDITDYTNLGGMVTDNCSSVFTVTYADSVLVASDTLIRIYDIEDESGNGVEVEHIIIITDEIPPVISLPSDVTIACNEDKDDLMITGSASADDDCFGDAILDYTDVLISEPCTLVYNRVWTATDEAGNTSTAVQVVTVIDNMGPLFNGLPGAISDVECNEALPVQQVLTATDLCNPPAIVSFDTIRTGNVCDGFDVTYVWTATDACSNTSQVFQYFDINEDDNLPTITDPMDVTVDTDNGVCIATLLLPNPAVADVCSGVTVTKNPVGNIYNKGLTIVTWTATDDCGNSATVQQNVTVEDNEAPELTCKGLRTIDLSYGINTLPADNFVDLTTDNCPGDLTILARRMDIVCSPLGNVFQEDVLFCCEDVGDTIAVVVQVTDASGNSSTCMTMMIVNDKLAPVLEEGLRDISISCDYFIDLNDLSAFGTYVFNQNDRDTIVINDELFETLPGDFLDGWVTDNCEDGLVLTTLPPLDERQHNYGNIVRRFVVTDESGNSISLQQVITVVDTDPLTSDDIIWPADIEVTDCENFPPDTTSAGSPQYNYDDICTRPASSFKDNVFDDPTSGCALLVRRWTVIDWAQYVPNTNIGIWYHTQNIHLINSVPPAFVSSCENRTVCAGNAACDAIVRLGALAEDDCTDQEDLYYDYTVDLFSNGSKDISGKSDTFDITMARGLHTITWRVEDRCGNLSSCSYTVLVKECKAPTPVCMNGLSTNLVNNGLVEIWASDFNIGSSDNCTPKEQLKFSFSSDVNNIGLTLTCEDADQNVGVSMWVTDLDGNQSKCNTYIKVTDLLNICPDSLPDNTLNIAIAGRIATEENDMIKSANIVLSKNNVSKTIQTDDTGNFIFGDLNMYENYEVTPEYNADWLNGLSTLDLIIIQRHILNLKKIDSPYKLIAADANNDAKITAGDLVELRKLVLGVQSEIASNRSWRFVDKSFVIPNPLSPWPYKESTLFVNLDANKMATDFIAVKTGDVNGSYTSSVQRSEAENREAKELILNINDEHFESNRYLNVPVMSSGLSETSGFQFKLNLDKSNLKFVGIMSEGIEITKDQYHYNEQEGTLSFVYYNGKPIELSDNGVLFTLQFSTLDKNKLSNVITMNTMELMPEAYAGNLEKYAAVLRYNDNMDAMSVAQNVPNPFSEQTEIKFFIYDDAVVEVSVYDNNGSRIYNAIKPYKGGMNSIIIGKDEIGDARGVFYLHISSAERKEIKKMIRIN